MDSVININQRKTLGQKAAEEDIRRTENKVSYYTLRKEVFDPILEEFETSFDVVSVSLDISSIDISIAGKRDVLVKAFGILRRAEFNTSHRPEENKASYSAYFTNPSGAKIWLSFSSTQCRRVQVGTETVEQPVYETVCDDV